MQITDRAGDPETLPFAEWGTRRAADHAVDYIRSLLTAESLLDNGVDVFEGRISNAEGSWTRTAATSTESEFDRAVEIGPIVSHTHVYDRHGNLVSEPTVSFRSLVEMIPRSITVTIQFTEKAYTATLPVLCRRVAEQME